MAVDALTGSSMSHQPQAVTHLHRDINRRIVDATCVLRVLEIVEEASQDFNAVNISTAFHRLARMWRDLPDLNSSSNHAQARLDHALQTLMQLAVSHIKEVQGQGLGIIIWALAKICYDPLKIRTLLQAFAQEAISRLTAGVPKNEPNLKLGPQSLSNMVYAYAVMGHHPGDKLLNAIAQGVQGQLTDFSPQGLSNIVWAYAKLSALPNPRTEDSLSTSGTAKGAVDSLLNALAVEAVKQLLDVRHSHKFIPQNLSNMVYGYAVMGHEPGPMLLLAVAQQALIQLDSFSPQEITNMIWAYAKLVPAGQPLMGPLHALMQGVPDHVVRQLADDSQHHKVRPQTVSNLLWAYATLGWAPAHLLASLALETLRQLPFFKPQELANTLWAYASLGFTPSLEWLVQMGAACEEHVRGCKPPDLANLVWALATLRFHPGAPFLITAMDTANRQWDKFKPVEVSNLVWALAQLGAPAHPALLHNVVSLAETESQDLTPADVCKLLWGLAVLDSLPRKTAATLYGYLSPHYPQAFSPVVLQQLAQVDIWLGSGEGAMLQLLPQAIQQAVTAAWLANLQQHQPSKMVGEVSAALTMQGIAHTAPFLIEQGPLLVDIALLGPKQNTALQLESPAQLSVNAPWATLGGTCLMQQTLRNKGWQVIGIPFYIWGMLTTAPLRGAYLHQLLQLCQALRPNAAFAGPGSPPQLYAQAQQDPPYLQQQAQQLQGMKQQAQQPSSPFEPSQAQQQSQLHQQLQAQLLRQLQGMSLGSPPEASVATSAAMPWAADPRLAAQLAAAQDPAKMALMQSAATAQLLQQQLAQQHSQQQAEQLTQQLAQHAQQQQQPPGLPERLHLAPRTSHESSDNPSPVSDSSATNTAQLPVGHFSPMSSRYSHDSQVPNPSPTAPTLSASQQSSSPPGLKEALQATSADFQGQWGLAVGSGPSHGPGQGTSGEALPQQGLSGADAKWASPSKTSSTDVKSQQRATSGSGVSHSPGLIGNSPGQAPSFWAGQQGQKAMAEGQQQQGSSQQGPGQLGFSQQGSSQQGSTEQGFADAARAAPGFQQGGLHQAESHRRKLLGLAPSPPPQGSALQGASHMALPQQAHFQHASSRHGQMMQPRNSPHQSSPREGRAVGSPGYGEAHRAAPVARSSDAAAASIQALVMQLQSAGLQSQASLLDMPVGQYPGQHPQAWNPQARAITSQNTPGSVGELSHQLAARFGVSSTYSPAAPHAAYPFLAGSPGSSLDQAQNFWQPRPQHPGSQYAVHPSQHHYGAPQPPSPFHAHGPRAGQYPLQQPYYPPHHQHYAITKQM